MTAPPPDHLARLQTALAASYALERELGGGGMSRVFVAMDRSLARRVVIKVLLPELAAGLSVERFRREIMLAAGLQHPNIVPVLAAGEAEGLPYFIMPYVEGESLRDRMVRGPLSVREAVNVARDVARALSFAHGRGIVHRDVKPGNVLLSAGAAFVTDFGVAKALSVAHREAGAPRSGDPAGPAVRMAPTLTQAGTSLGTPAYMAPEQAAADPRADHRADIYSLGVVLYEILAGTLPFHGRTPQALLTAQLSETPPAIATRRYDVPQKLADLLAQCLEKDPARRPRTAAELLRALEDPGVLSGAFAVPPAVRRRSRRTLLLGALAGIAIVATALVGWQLLRTAAEDPLAEPPIATLPPAGAPPAAAPRVTGRAVAVLPLIPIGGDARAREVAEGLASQLASALAAVPGTRVAAPTVAGAVPSEGTPAQLAQTLGVDLLVDGTVQREGERLRVVLRIVDPLRDAAAWSGRFDAQTGGALDLQDQATQALVAALATLGTTPG